MQSPAKLYFTGNNHLFGTLERVDNSLHFTGEVGTCAPLVVETLRAQRVRGCGLRLEVAKLCVEFEPLGNRLISFKGPVDGATAALCHKVIELWNKR